MALITSVVEFRNYIRRQLGHPVIQIEVDDTQLNDIIDDTIQTFQRYNYGEGNYMDYLVFTTSANVGNYSMDGLNINDVYDLDLSSGNDGINTLFSPTHTMLYNDWVVQGNYPGNNSGGYVGNQRFLLPFGSRPSVGMELSDYTIQMQQLKENINTFGIMYNVDWLPGRQELRVTPTPDVDGVGLLTVYLKETAANLYNNLLVKNLAVAKSKKQWFLHLSKYGFALPGGGTINGPQLMADANEEEKQALLDIRDESLPNDFFMG